MSWQYTYSKNRILLIFFFFLMCVNFCLSFSLYKCFILLYNYVGFCMFYFFFSASLIHFSFFYCSYSVVCMCPASYWLKMNFIHSIVLPIWFSIFFFFLLQTNMNEADKDMVFFLFFFYFEYINMHSLHTILKNDNNQKKKKRNS